MIFSKKPKGYKPKFEVSSCFLEHKGKILLLLRQDHKPEGNTWAVPAGKIDLNESPIEAILRETKEEIGCTLNANQLTYFRKVYVRFKKYDFDYHIFHCNLKVLPNIELNQEEHKRHTWVTPKESLGMNLIQDEDACIKLRYF